MNVSAVAPYTVSISTVWRARPTAGQQLPPLADQRQHDQIAAWHPCRMTRVPTGVSEAAVACSLSQADLTRRQRRWLLLEHAHIDSEATANGLQLRFRNEPTTKHELKELIALEQDCCAFAAWSLHNHGDRLVLDVTADSAEGIAAVHAMFRTL